MFWSYLAHRRPFWFDCCQLPVDRVHWEVLRVHLLNPFARALLAGFMEMKWWHEDEQKGIDRRGQKNASLE